MSRVTLGINILLAIGLVFAGFYLLSVDSFAVSDTTFTGVALYCLVLCIFCLAGLSGTIAHAPMRGTCHHLLPSDAGRPWTLPITGQY